MSLLRHWKIVLCLVTIVAVSGLAGAKFGYQKAKRDLRAKHNPEQWNERAMHSIDAELQLSPKQRVKVQTLIDEAVGEMKVVQGETVGRTTEIINKLVADLEHELTEDQKVKFSKMKPKDSDVTIDLLKVQPRKK